MYIIKNALRCISRAKGRNILIGIIVLVIAISACIGLSIRQAAVTAKEEALDSMSVTATISFDTSSMMSSMMEKGHSTSEGEKPSFDREQFSEMMNGGTTLSLEEYQKYAEAESVQSFYYTLTSYVNGSDDFSPVSTDVSTADEAETDILSDSEYSVPNAPQGGGQMMGNMMSMNQTDFTIIGYSGDDAMTDFIDGNATITEGAVFDEGTENYDCIIPEELATFNSLSVGDSVVITNSNNEDETYSLNIVGIYTSTVSDENPLSMMGFSNSSSANTIYMSYNALKTIVDLSAENTTTLTDEDTGKEYETALDSYVSGTYTFADTDDYYAFAEEVYELGLDESYAVSSSDITMFENSMLPLETLSETAGWFLLVILIIGAVILIVLNIFNVRERKYEIGVLTAMGMKKSKVAMQFITEIFVVTLIAVIIGIVIGAVSSVPVANALLENRATSQQAETERQQESFGREGSFGGRGNMDMADGTGGDIGDIPNAPQGGFMENLGNNQVTEYVMEINSAMNFTVVLQMLGIAILLTLISGAASMLFIMRYEPLKILANRD